MRRFRHLIFNPSAFPLVLLLVAVLSYGLLIPWLGFYWDDWHFVWISQRMGSAGLARYFMTNRPYWGMIYQFTTSLLKSAPWHWQVFGLFWRLASAVSLWGLLRLIWPKVPQAATWVSILFLVYPGFDQQPIAITYGHFFLVLTAFFLSLIFMVLALRHPGRYWLFTSLGLLFSFINLLTLEYFFLLDLVRPVLLWVVLGEKLPDKSEWKKRFGRAFSAWLPFLLLFVGMTIWRAFFFKVQTHNYQPLLLGQLRLQPLQTILVLAGLLLHDLWMTSFGAWAKAFVLPDVNVLGSRTFELYAVLVGLSAAALIFYLLKQNTKIKVSENQQAWAIPAICIGIFVMLLAGWPFWLTGLQIGLVYPVSRFTLPFMPGVSLLLAGLLALIPVKQWIKLGILGLAVSFAVGFQFQVATSYRRDTNTQDILFWEMAWRMPGLRPDTLILSNDLPVNYFSDNSMTAPLNWIYAPNNSSSSAWYAFYYPTIRLGTSLKGLDEGIPIQHDYLAATFNGSTSQAVAIDFSPPACLRVLDPQLDPQNEMLPEMIRSSAVLSNTAQILVNGSAAPLNPPAAQFGKEPAHGWCYYFEKADLARQLQDWQQVTALGDLAFQLKDYPNDPSERIPFIEGYAHVGNWQRAKELTQESAEVSSLMRPMLCGLWQRIAQTTHAGPEKDDTIKAVNNKLHCTP
ncbi:MAG: hypothetical protein P4L50_22675 [Anaerolineaceae bacterium]|nr:hypothetical protein [Anaerolineaceae bacterium]